jgi:hypothetical protein
MQSISKSPQEYIDLLPPDRKEAISKIREVLLKNLPQGFEETIGYGMLGYVVPHAIYPKGYHCNPKLPLPYINLASQKNFIALHAMSVYADPKLKDWFINEYQNHCKTRLDMGAGCIRFKKMNDIPYQLIGELAGKLTPRQWIEICERMMKR